MGQHFFDMIVQTVINDAKEYVDGLKNRMPSKKHQELAEAAIKEKAHSCGFVGAITGIGGVITLPIAIPADLAATWRMQAVLLVTIAFIYGRTEDNTDFRAEILGLFIGDSVKGNACKETTERAGLYLSMKLAGKAGLKWASALGKVVPFVGAPIGYAADYAVAWGVGKYAIRRFRHEKPTS